MVDRIVVIVSSSRSLWEHASVHLLDINSYRRDSVTISTSRHRMTSVSPSYLVGLVYNLNIPMPLTLILVVKHEDRLLEVAGVSLFSSSLG